MEGLEAGGQLTLTTMVENYPGFRSRHPGSRPDGRRCAQQAAHFGTEIVQGNVTAVDLRSGPSRSTLADGRAVTTDALIIATGASARWLDIGSDRKLPGRGVSTCATCDGYFFRGKPIAVVGGGDSAMEEAIYLSRLASKVTVDPSARHAARVEDHAGQGAQEPEDRVHLELGDRRGQGRRRRARSTGIVVRNLKTGADARSVPLDGVFIAIGHTPNTSLFKGQIDLDENGYIVTHHGTQTSVPGVFAAGDVQDHVYRQAVTAAGTGCMAALDAERYLEGLPEDEDRRDDQSVDCSPTAVALRCGSEPGLERLWPSSPESPRPRAAPSLDPPAADHHVAVVEHHCLARRDGRLRLVELELGAGRPGSARTRPARRE